MPLPVAGAVAGATGAAASASHQQTPPKKDKTHTQDSPQETPIIIQKELPKLENIFDETCSSFKEIIIEDILVAPNLIESGHARAVRTCSESF